MSIFDAGAVEFVVVDAQRQARTAMDVPLYWCRPKPPSKRRGRKGTRRGWKRKNPPHMVFAYREPTDMLVIGGRRFIVTERQYAEIKRMPEVRDLAANPWPGRRWGV